MQPVGLRSVAIHPNGQQLHDMIGSQRSSRTRSCNQLPYHQIAEQFSGGFFVKVNRIGYLSPRAGLDRCEVRSLWH